MQEDIQKVEVGVEAQKPVIEAGEKSVGDVQAEALKAIEAAAVKAGVDIKNLENTEGDSIKKQISELLKSENRNDIDKAAELFDKLEIVDSETASEFVDVGLGSMIARNLDRIKGATGELVVKLIKAGETTEVLLHSGFIEKGLSENDLIDVASVLIDKNIPLDRELFKRLDVKGNHELNIRADVASNKRKIMELEGESKLMEKMIEESVQKRKER